MEYILRRRADPPRPGVHIGNYKNTPQLLPPWIRPIPVGFQLELGSPHLSPVVSQIHLENFGP